MNLKAYFSVAIVMNIRQQKYAKNMRQIYYCDLCDYKCVRKFLWEQHLSTRKHKSATTATIHQPNNMPLSEEKYVCKICTREYKQRSGLWRHKKNCNVDKPTKININESTHITEHEDDMKFLVKEMMIHMKKQSDQLSDQTKIINEMIPKLGSNNNNRFNINVFLNEQCKEAINMSDFLESLKIQLSDINYIRDNGLIDGISSVLINGLKSLDAYKRPIHCTDIKREVLYIKDNDEWERDDGKEKMFDVIEDVAQKHRASIASWEKSNPLWAASDRGKDEYINLVQTVMCDAQESGNKNKIIKSVAKTTNCATMIKN
jgi:hypothetical protein